MTAASSYSFVAIVDTGSSSVTMTGRFQAPNLIEQTVTGSGSAPVTMVLDGTSVHLMDPTTGAWTTTPAAATAAVDLRSTFAAIADAGGVRTEGDSSAFRLTVDRAKQLAGREATGPADVTVTITPAGITRLAYSVAMQSHPVTVTITYSDIGSSPAVTVPD